MKDVGQSLATFDWYIGEAEFIGKEIGQKALKLFLEKHVFPNFDYVFVDSDTTNINAIRAYEKISFKTIKKVRNDEITWMILEKHGVTIEN